MKKAKIRHTVYTNGISSKLHNRRVTVIKEGDGFHIEFQIIDHNYKPRIISRLVRGKINVSSFNLSREAAEVLIIDLAEMLKLKDKYQNS
ncbi:MAG: hypothetical protein HN704_18300 [Bacteroidetes bacterium]|jgi:hypothetical protein|nr:hypothetical protein [Bacteroidota bacterium]MBT7493555.1 hypothetical protein [Bacteroidota bacterium]